MFQKTATILLAGFLIGVACQSFLNFGWSLVYVSIFLSVIFLILYFLKFKLFSLFAIFLLAFGFGAGRYEMMERGEKDKILTEKVGSKIEIAGVIDDEPDEREEYTRLIISAEGKILVYARSFPKFNYGDEVKIFGELREPKNYQSESFGQNVFDWKSYLAKDEIFYEMIYPKITFVAAGKGSALKAKLYQVKEKFLMALGRAIPEPESAFLGGLTIGARQSMPKELTEDFKKSGVLHLVALSGYNITLVADTIMKVLGFLPQVVGLSFGVLGIILFTLMTGASASAARAAFMSSLVLLARMTGRIYTITWALFLAAFFMVLYNPKILRFDSSFQLSFLATVAMIYLSPIIEKKLIQTPLNLPLSGEGANPPDKGELKGVSSRILTNLKQILASTLAVQILLAPVLLYKTGYVSLSGIFANLFILPFIPMTMFFGFAVGLLGMLVPQRLGGVGLATPFGWVSYIFLKYEISVAQFFAKMPNWLAGVLIVTTVAVITTIIFLRRKKEEKEQAIRDSFDDDELDEEFRF